MKLLPIITEKSLSDAKKGKYTFKVGLHMTKFEIKKAVEDAFKVHVVNVNTTKEAGEVKRTMWGRKRVLKPGKKAVVMLKEKESIDLFETKK